MRRHHHRWLLRQSRTSKHSWVSAVSCQPPVGAEGLCDRSLWPIALDRPVRPITDVIGRTRRSQGTLTLILRVRNSTRLGTRTVSSPSLRVASIRSVSSSPVRTKVRRYFVV